MVFFSPTTHNGIQESLSMLLRLQESLENVPDVSPVSEPIQPIQPDTTHAVPFHTTCGTNGTPGTKHEEHPESLRMLFKSNYSNNNQEQSKEERLQNEKYPYLAIDTMRGWRIWSSFSTCLWGCVYGYGYINLHTYPCHCLYIFCPFRQ